MALNSSSTETDAINQFYNNVEGWRGDASKAASLISAIEWLSLRHQMSQLSDEGARFVMSDIVQKVWAEAQGVVSTSNSSRPAMFSRTRVTGMG